MEKYKFIITKIKMYFGDGTRNTVNVNLGVNDVQKYREELMIRNDAQKVEFVYDTIE